MGLALCQKIAALHDAYLEITSELGKGTEITVVFPAAAGRAKGGIAMKRKGYILLMGLSVMLPFFPAAAGDSRVQIVEPKEAVKGNPGETDTRTVREQGPGSGRAEGDMPVSLRYSLRGCQCYGAGMWTALKSRRPQRGNLQSWSWNRSRKRCWGRKKFFIDESMLWGQQHDRGVL